MRYKEGIWWGLLGASVLLAAGCLTSWLVGDTGVQQEAAQAQSPMAIAERYYDEGKYLEAILQLEDMMQVDGQNGDALLLLSQTYVGARYFEDAESAYLACIALDSGNVTAWIDLSELYIRQGKLDEAEALLRDSLKSLSNEALTSLYASTQVATPSFSLPAGTYTEYQLLSLQHEDSDALLYYTLDGTPPDRESTLYTEPIVLCAPEYTIRAVAINSRGYQSEIGEAVYLIDVPQEEVELTNDMLRNLVLNTLNKNWNDPIYNHEMASITSLYIVGYDNSEQVKSTVFYADGFTIYSGSSRNDYAGYWSDMEDMRWMPFLRQMSLGYQGEISLQGIEACSRLEELSLTRCELTDVSALASLTSLKRLSLGQNEIRDVSPLAALTGLESLGLWGNAIRDISPLAALANLSYFDISSNEITDISAVESMSSLQEFWAFDNQITSLEPLASLDRLQVLMVAGNPLEERDTLRTLSGRLSRLDTMP